MQTELGNVYACCADIPSCEFLYDYEEFKIYFVIVDYMVSKVQFFFNLATIDFSSRQEMLMIYTLQISYGMIANTGLRQSKVHT